MSHAYFFTDIHNVYNSAAQMYENEVMLMASVALTESFAEEVSGSFAKICICWWSRHFALKQSNKIKLISLLHRPQQLL